MSDNIDFKALWQKQPMLPTPDMEVFIKQAGKFKIKTRNKFLFSGILLLATIFALIAIACYYKPKMITTKVGIILAILAIVMYIISLGKILQILFKANIEESSKAYLEQMIAVRKEQTHLQTTILGAYFILLSTGVLLYIYEYVLLMSTTGKILAYGLTLAWFAFNWFYVRPKTIQKQQAKTNELISNLEKAYEGLKEEV
ncbi:hypothetical protein ACI6Q2_04205 [Chitinophagaceae bacterium LWZ2-11]